MKIKKNFKKIVAIVLIILFLGASVGIFYLLFLKENPEDLWYSESWSYRKSIFLDIPKGSPTVKQDILIELDTSTLISEGKLEANCNDIRFVDQDNSTILKYWIEGGCNTPNTQIWVRVLIPKATEKVLYLYYGNKLAPDGQEKWNGQFITMSLTDCEDNWTLEEDFTGRFPLGDSSYGKTGGDTGHKHQVFERTTEESCVEKAYVATTAQDNCDTSTDNIVSNSTTNFSNIPNYVDVNFCSSKNGYLSSNSIILLDKETPSGWEHISDFDEKFPRGSNQEKPNFSNSHTHKLTCINSELSSEEGKESYLTLDSSTATPRTSREPSYFTTNFVSNNAGGVIPSGSILMFTEVPPLGWEVYSDIDGRIIKGDVEKFKDTGGTDAHFHTGKVDYSLKNTTAQKLLSIDTEELCLPLTSNGERDFLQSKNMPPYITVLFAQKKSVNFNVNEIESTTEGSSQSGSSELKNIGVSIDEEKTKEEVENDTGDVLGATAPTAPSDLLTEGEINPTALTVSKPKFSAIYNDPDSTDTSSYYEIEVNTTSDFTGTVMWDSGKSSMSTTNQGSRSPDITYGGDTLLENTTYYWRIKFWDSDNNVSPWSSNASFTLASTPTATSLLTCGNSNPTFITTNLTFSAIYTDPGSSNATNYEIEINTASDFTGTIIWDSGKTPITIISGQRSEDLAYGGSALTHDNTLYYVRLRFWDSNDIASDWVTGQFNDLLKGFRLDGLNVDGVNLD